MHVCVFMGKCAELKGMCYYPTYKTTPAKPAMIFTNVNHLNLLKGRNFPEDTVRSDAAVYIKLDLMVLLFVKK